MFRKTFPLLAVMLLVGCDVPGVPSFGGAGPTITGSVTKLTGNGIRVSLMGSPAAGAAQREIASTAASGGQFSLTLPGAPPIDLMQQPDESSSIVFTLRAYQDGNSNGKYDSGEQLCDCSNGQFRYFTSDGPAGSWKAGWNNLAGGRYTQTFTTAFVL
jgi:hypothetical protein